MNIDYIANPIYIDWLRDNNGNKISLPVNNEQKQVADNRMILNYIPDQFYKVTFSVGSTPTTEISISESITNVNQYKVDYSMGYIYLHPNLEASLLTCSYYKRGVIMYPASRIYTSINNQTGDIEQTLQQQAENISTYDYKGVYNNLIIYVQNNIVAYQGSTYICIVEISTGIAPTDNTKWRFLAAGYNSAGVFSNSVQYYARDVVYYDNNKYIYVCVTQPSIGTLPTNATYWEKMIDLKSIYDAEYLRISAESNRVIADGSRTTAEGLRVIAEGGRVSSEGIRVGSENTRIGDENIRISNNNTYTISENLRISQESTRQLNELTRISQENDRQDSISNFKHVGEWNAGLVMYKNNICTYGGSSFEYVSSTPSTTSQPIDNGITYSLIAQAGSNIKYRGLYDNLEVYFSLDVVDYNNYTYICILDSTGNNPDNSTYWTVYNQMKIGEIKNVITLPTTINTFNISIPEYNKSSDILEIIQNNIVIFETEDYVISSFSQGRIDKVSGNWNSGTVFYIRVLKNMRVTLNFNDGTMIEPESIGIGSLSPSIQDAIEANTKRIHNYTGTITIPFASSTNTINVGTYVPQYDYLLDALDVFLNSTYLSDSLYTKSGNNIILISGVFGGLNIGDSDVLDFVVKKAMSSTPLNTFSGSLIENGTINKLALSSIPLQNLSDLDSSTGLVAQTGTNTFTKRTIAAGTSKILITHGDGVSDNPTIDIDESELSLALLKSGGTMTGTLVAQSNTSYTTAQVHNVILSTGDAVVGDMNNGDIWIKYV